MQKLYAGLIRRVSGWNVWDRRRSRAPRKIGIRSTEPGGWLRKKA